MSKDKANKCSLFQNEDCIYDVTILNCEDCMFKQLQRLKQENEELKEEIKSLKQSLEEISKTNYFINQNDRLEKENEELKKGWYKSTKCHHLVLDECSLTGKTCKGLQECFKQAEKELLNNREELEELRQVRKDMPDIQEPYVILYRQIKKEYAELEEKLKQADEDIKGECTRCATVNRLSEKLDKIKEIVKEWRNNKWSCFKCRSNMDEKLDEILAIAKGE